jgi:hypothetical protein
MLHPCLCTICFVFCYTSWHFYAFSELTYWRDAIVPVPYFLLFLCFREDTQEIFSELDEMKPKPPISPRHEMKTEGEPEGGQGPTTPRGGTPLLAVPGGGLGPLAALWRYLSAYIKPSDPETLDQSVFFRERVLQLHRRHRQVSGDRSLCSSTLPGRGSAPGAISFNAIDSIAVSIDFTAISTNVAVSYDEEGVVLPQGWGLYR